MLQTLQLEPNLGTLLQWAHAIVTLPNQQNEGWRCIKTVVMLKLKIYFCHDFTFVNILFPILICDYAVLTVSYV